MRSGTWGKWTISVRGCDAGGVPWSTEKMVAFRVLVAPQVLPLQLDSAYAENVIVNFFVPALLCLLKGGKDEEKRMM